jgi:hypothetical protein
VPLLPSVYVIVLQQCSKAQCRGTLLYRNTMMGLIRAVFVHLVYANGEQLSSCVMLCLVRLVLHVGAHTLLATIAQFASCNTVMCTSSAVHEQHNRFI